MSPFQVYWLIKLNAISEVLAGLGYVFMIIWLVLLVLFCQSFDKTDDSDSPLDIDSEIMKDRLNRREVSKKYLYIIFPASVLFFVASVMLPTTKEMCAIIVVPKVINAAQNSEALKQMPEVILNTANEWIKEATPSNIKSGLQDVIKEVKR